MSASRRSSVRSGCIALKGALRGFIGSVRGERHDEDPWTRNASDRGTPGSRSASRAGQARELRGDRTRHLKLDERRALAEAEQLLATLDRAERGPGDTPGRRAANGETRSNLADRIRGGYAA